MPKVYTNRGLQTLQAGTAWSGGKQVLALTGAVQTPSTIADLNFVAQLTATNPEVAVAGYTRQAVTITPTENDTLNQVDAAYPATVTFGATVAAGATVTCVACFLTAGATDALKELLWVDNLSAPANTAGGPLIYTPVADKLAMSPQPA